MSINGTILIAEDETVPRKTISQVLENKGYGVVEAADGRTAIAELDRTDFFLVLTDLKMPGADGLEVLRHVREVSPQTLVIVMTAFASVDTAVEALRLGAQDYILKPIALQDLLSKVDHLMEHRSLAWEIQLLRREVNEGLDPTKFVGRSKAMQQIGRLMDKVAPTDSTVLITGESGVGKEVVARAIHLQSPRKHKVFLPVNCSAIPETILESQIFGHVKGAFTGALTAQEGLFQGARGGTIFLDEIGEIPQNVQAKLLRAIEEKEVLPVGSTRSVQVDVRIIAATNRDLKKEVEEHRFRDDLYFRLNVFNISMPPLRERREDIPPLVEHLVRRNNLKMKKAYKGVSNEAMRIVMSLPWKGNVRELDNVLERAMILGNGEWILPEDLPRDETASAEGLSTIARGDSFKRSMETFEKLLIESVLKETMGDRNQAAKLLGLSRSSLYRKIEKLNIPLKIFARPGEKI